MINLETILHWALYAERLAGVLRRRHFVSSLDLMVFCMRISGVMYGLGERLGRVIVLIGACLSRRLERVVVKRETYDAREVGLLM